MKKLKLPLLNTLRFALGVLFLFSGFVKCVDPAGNAIKINDYFVAWGFDVPFAISMFLSFVQNIAEFLAGYMLVFGVAMPAASLVALLFMAVFTPLTLYIAIANPVSDCGCFGDAVKLSNWGTFFKNLVFLPISIVVFAYRKHFVNRLNRWRTASVCGLGALVGFVVSVSGVTNEPFIDFRPYAVGVDIREAMTIPADAPQPEYRSTFILEKDGVQQEFDEMNYPYDDSTWVYVDTRTEVISEGYVPPIKDFTLTDRYGNVVTDDILASGEPVFLLISPKLEEVAAEHVPVVRHLADVALENGHALYIATASLQPAQTQFESAAEYGFDFLTADETMLKTITRCNPGLIVLQHGVVVAKYHINHLPFDKELVNPMASYLRNIEAQNARQKIISTIFALGILLILLYKKHKRNSK